MNNEVKLYKYMNTSFDYQKQFILNVEFVIYHGLVLVKKLSKSIILLQNSAECTRNSSEDQIQNL